MEKKNSKAEVLDNAGLPMMRRPILNQKRSVILRTLIGGLT
jgi:hypothetical protein